VRSFAQQPYLRLKHPFQPPTLILHQFRSFCDSVFVRWLTDGISGSGGTGETPYQLLHILANRA